MTPLVVENEPPVTFLRRKMTGGRFSMGGVIRRYTGMDGCTSDGKEFKDVFGFPDPYGDIRSTWVFGRM